VAVLRGEDCDEDGECVVASSMAFCDGKVRVIYVEIEAFWRMRGFKTDRQLLNIIATGNIWHQQQRGHLKEVKV